MSKPFYLPLSKNYATTFCTARQKNVLLQLDFFYTNIVLTTIILL